MSPANVAMPPAVLRTIAPEPEPEEADDRQVERCTDHRPRHGGSVSPTSMCRPEKIDSPITNAHQHGRNRSARVTRP
jgi:hypothetical protein